MQRAEDFSIPQFLLDLGKGKSLDTSAVPAIITPAMQAEDAVLLFNA